LKKLSAILLLVIFMFNLVGYRIWFYVVEQQWELQLQSNLDKSQYNEADLITIRAPLTLPYVTDTREFQRTDGEIKLNGKIYHYVKSKIENGEYVLLCLPNDNKQNLETAKENFFKDASDFFNTSKKPGSSKSSSFKNIISDYNCYYFTFIQPTVNSVGINYNHQPSTNLVSLPHLAPLHPPEVG
jgi:hypothetical protein